MHDEDPRIDELERENARLQARAAELERAVSHAAALMTAWGYSHTATEFLTYLGDRT
jgi:hypothetical protein